MGFSIKLLFCGYLTASFLITNGLKHEKIIGGQLTLSRKYTYNVYIKNEQGGTCSGAIIGKKSVITAAHCLYDGQGRLRGSKITVVAGTNKLADKADENRVSIDVVKFYVHKATIRQMQNMFNDMDTEIDDIAVLQLEKSLKVDNNKYISKLQLLEKDESLVGKKVVISGYGGHDMSNDKNPPFPLFDGKLRNIEATITDAKNCVSRFFRDMVLRNPEKFLCAEIEQHSYIKTHSTCKGDSGGPLMLNDRVLVGIVSFGSAYCSYPVTLIVNVAKYKDFIGKAMNDKPDRTMHCEILKSSNS